RQSRQDHQTTKAKDQLKKASTQWRMLFYLTSFITAGSSSENMPACPSKVNSSIFFSGTSNATLPDLVACGLIGFRKNPSESLPVPLIHVSTCESAVYSAPSLSLILNMLLSAVTFSLPVFLISSSIIKYCPAPGLYSPPKRDLMDFFA